MEMYWALDYVDDYECELVLGDQLYPTEEAARAAAKNLENVEVNWYTLNDLEDDVYTVPITIDEHLHVCIEK